MFIDPRPDDSLFRFTRLLREQGELQTAARHDAWRVVGKQIDAFDAEAITLRAKHDALMDKQPRPSSTWRQLSETSSLRRSRGGASWGIDAAAMPPTTYSSRGPRPPSRQKAEIERLRRQVHELRAIIGGMVLRSELRRRRRLPKALR
jgi:hypothetical protein